MSVTFYPKRNGEYVYDVIVTEDLQARPSRRYRAHLSNAQRIEHGRLAHVQVDVTDTYGPTITEAVGALDAVSKRGGRRRKIRAEAPPAGGRGNTRF
jgi:hypothetical protein